MEDKKSLIYKTREVINKLPFNSFAEKIPQLAKFAKYANYIFCVLILLFVVILALPRSPSIVGTWIFEYDGSNGGRVIVDKDTESLAQQLIVFKRNGSYYSRNPKTRTTKVDTVTLRDGTFAFYAVDYKEHTGKWSLNNGVLEVKYDDGSGYKYNDGEFELDKKTLKLGQANFHKK